MRTHPALVALAFLSTTLVARADDQPADEPKPLALLAEDKHPSFGQVQVQGKNPSVIFIPIIHDAPLNRVSSTDVGGVKAVMENCQTIATHLHDAYGVQNILLEGVSKQVADHYNKPETDWQKISWGKTATITYDTWGKILRGKRWHLLPAFDVKPLGPLTLLGREYNDRIHKALKKAKDQGWFKTRKAFTDNQAEFTALINKACDGYNSKLEQILKEDPGLKKEYAITVAKRNKIFLDNLAAADGPGIVLCGKGHFQDLVLQLKERDASYIVAVPAGVDWPPTEKDDETIFADMRKLGCQLREVSLGFGDGGAAKIKLPIE